MARIGECCLRPKENSRKRSFDGKKHQSTPQAVEPVIPEPVPAEPIMPEQIAAADPAPPADSRTITKTEICDLYGINTLKLRRILPIAAAELGITASPGDRRHDEFPIAILDVLEKQNPELALKIIDPRYWRSINAIYLELARAGDCAKYASSLVEAALRELEDSALAELNSIINQPVNDELVPAVENLKEAVLDKRPIVLDDVCKPFRKEKRAYHLLMYLLMMPELKKRMRARREEYQEKPAGKLLVTEVIERLADNFNEEDGGLRKSIIKILSRLLQKKDPRVEKRRVIGINNFAYCCDPEIIDYLKKASSLQRFKKNTI